MVLVAHLAPEDRLALTVEYKYPISNNPNLVAHLAPKDWLALHLALLLSSVAALLDRLLAALASILKHGWEFIGI